MDRPPAKVTVTLGTDQDNEPRHQSFRVINKTIIHHAEILPGVIVVGTLDQIQNMVGQSILELVDEHLAAQRDLADEQRLRALAANRRELA